MSERPTFNTWEEAFAVIRERNAPQEVSVQGHPYKLYPSGRALCVASRPPHRFTGDHCDCMGRESGGTIASFTLRLGRSR